MSQGRFKNPFTAVFTGIYDLARTPKQDLELDKSDHLKGKTCLVTGANSGLGFGITVELAKKGAKVIMACRKNYINTMAKARKMSQSNDIEIRVVDLTNMQSIRQFVDSLVIDHIRIDVSIHNAGVTPPKARKTRDGLDEMFMVNYLSKFILIRDLLKKNIILQYPNDGQPGRVIIISSDSHQKASAIDFDAFGKFENYRGANRGVSLYSYNKLILNTFAYELSQRLIQKDEPVVSIFIICPGAVNTNIIRDAPFFLRIFLRFIFTLFFKNPIVAAKPVVYLAAARDLNNQTGLYFHINRKKKMDPKVYDRGQGFLLWEHSEKLVKETF